MHEPPSDDGDDAIICSALAAHEEPRKRRRCHAPFISQGPLCVVCVFGSCIIDKYSSTKSADSKWLQHYINHTLRVYGEDPYNYASLVDGPEVMCFGYCVMRSWEFDESSLREPLSRDPTPTLDDIVIRHVAKAAVQMRDRRSKPVPIHMPVHEAAYFKEPVPVNADVLAMSVAELSIYIDSTPSLRTGLHISEVTGNWSHDQQPPEDDFHLNDLIRFWSMHHDIPAPLKSPSVFSLSKLGAFGLVHGCVPSDVYTAVDKQRADVIRPGYPTLKTLRAYMSKARPAPLDLFEVDATLTQPIVVRLQGGRSIPRSTNDTRQFHPHHIIEGLRVSRRLVEPKWLEESVKNSIRYAIPDKADELIAEMDAAEWKPPSRSVLYEARSRFDMSCCVMRRIFNAGPGITRQLMFDASPQKGIEIFAVKELVIKDNDIRTAVKRSFVITSLGVGHFGTVDKAMRLLHSVAMENGFDKRSLQKFCSEVRVTLPDSGAEHIINDAPNIIDCFLRGDVSPLDLEGLKGTFLFPLSLRVPEANHVWDRMLRGVLWSRSYFAEFWLKLRAAIHFFRDDGDRQVMYVKAQIANDPRQHLIKTAPATAFKLRWGTILKASQWLNRALPISRDLFAKKDFPAGDEERNVRRNTVDDCIRCPKFAEDLRATEVLSAELEKIRKWNTACPCHEEECMEASRRSAVFDCLENRKSMRGPEMREKVMSAMQDWRRKQSTLSADDWSVAMLSDLHGGYSRMIGDAHLKWIMPLMRMPLALFEARTPAVAKRLQDQYNEEVDKGIPQNRVTEHFLNPNGDLAEHWSTHAAGDCLHPYLDEEFTHYERALFDGAPCEAVHKDVHRIMIVSTAAKFRYFASSHRLDQNFQEYDEFRLMRPTASIHNFFLKYKAVLQKRITSMNRLVASKLKKQQFWEKVYIIGVESMREWGALTPFFCHSERQSKQAKAIPAYIKKDFVKHMLENGSMYTVREQARPLAIADADSDLGLVVGPQRPSWRCFEVLDKNPQGKTIASKARTLDLFSPCLVQWWSVWGGPNASLPERLSIFPEGEPEIIDAVGVAPWLDLVATLTRWQDRAPSDYVGGTDLASPTLAKDLIPVPWVSNRTPIYSILALLKSSGFKPGDVDKHPLPLEDKVFLLENAKGKQSYLLCLLSAGELATRGYAQLDARQPATYYNCVLRNDIPAVEPGLGHTHYQSLLTGRAQPVIVPALGDVDGEGLSDIEDILEGIMSEAIGEEVDVPALEDDLGVFAMDVGGGALGGGALVAAAAPPEDDLEPAVAPEVM